MSFATSLLILGISLMYLTERRPVAESASRTLIPLNSLLFAFFSSSNFFLSFLAGFKGSALNARSTVETC